IRSEGLSQCWLLVEHYEEMSREEKHADISEDRQRPVKKRRTEKSEDCADVHRISHKTVRPPNHEPSRRIERRRRPTSYKGKREYAPERDHRASGSDHHSTNLQHSEYSRPRVRRSQ